MRTGSNSHPHSAVKHVTASNQKFGSLLFVKEIHLCVNVLLNWAGLWPELRAHCRYPLIVWTGFTVADSLIRDLGRVSEWCDLWGKKLNASKTKTVIVSGSRIMHPQSPPLTIGGTVLKESDVLYILGVTFYSKMIFEKHFSSVSRGASKRLYLVDVLTSIPW